MDIPQALQYLFEATDEELDGYVDLDMLLKVAQRLKDIASKHQASRSPSISSIASSPAISPRTCITPQSNDEDPTESTLTNNTQNLVAVRQASRKTKLKRKKPKERYVCIVEDLQKNISWLWNLRKRTPKHIIEVNRVENRDRRIVDIVGIDGKTTPTADEKLFLCTARRSLAIQYLNYEVDTKTKTSRLGDIHRALRCPQLSEKEKKDLLRTNRASLVPEFVKKYICDKEHADYNTAVRSVHRGIKHLASETDLEYQLKQRLPSETDLEHQLGLSNKPIHTCALSVITSISGENFRLLPMAKIVDLSHYLRDSCMITLPDDGARMDVLDIIHTLSPWFDSLQSHYDMEAVSCSSALRSMRASIPTEHAEQSNDYHSERRPSSEDSTFEDDVQTCRASSVVTDLTEDDIIEQPNPKRQRLSEKQSTEQLSGNRFSPLQVPEINSTPQSEERQDNARRSLPPISSLLPPTMRPAASPGGHAYVNDADSAYTTQRPLVPTPILSDSNLLPPDASTSSPDLQRPESSNVAQRCQQTNNTRSFDQEGSPLFVVQEAQIGLYPNQQAQYTQELPNNPSSCPDNSGRLRDVQPDAWPTFATPGTSRPTPAGYETSHQRPDSIGLESAASYIRDDQSSESAQPFFQDSRLTQGWRGNHAQHSIPYPMVLESDLGVSSPGVVPVPTPLTPESQLSTEHRRHISNTPESGHDESSAALSPASDLPYENTGYSKRRRLKFVQERCQQYPQVTIVPPQTDISRGSMETSLNSQELPNSTPHYGGGQPVRSPIPSQFQTVNYTRLGHCSTANGAATLILPNPRPGAIVTDNPNGIVPQRMNHSQQGPISSNNFACQKEDSRVPPSLCVRDRTGTHQSERVRNSGRASYSPPMPSPHPLGTMRPAESSDVHSSENDMESEDTAQQPLNVTPVLSDFNSLPPSLSYLLNDDYSIISDILRHSHLTSGGQETASTELHMHTQLSENPSSNAIPVDLAASALLFPRNSLENQQLPLTGTSRGIAALLCLLGSPNISMILFNRARLSYRCWGSDGEITKETVNICDMVNNDDLFQKSLDELQTLGGIARDAQSISIEKENLSKLASDDPRWKKEAVKIVFAAFPVDRRFEPAYSFSIAISILPCLKVVLPFIRDVRIDDGLTPVHVIDVCLSASEYSDMEWKDKCIETAQSVAEYYQVDHIFRTRITLREMKLSRLRSKWGFDINFEQLESLDMSIEDPRSNAYHGEKLLLISELFLETNDTNAALETLASYKYFNDKNPSTMEKSQKYQVKVQQGKILHFSGRFKEAESLLFESLKWEKQETTTPIQATIHLVGVYCELGDPGRGIRLAQGDLEGILKFHQHTTRPNTRIVKKLRLSLAYAYLMDGMWSCLGLVACNARSLDHAQALFEDLRESFRDGPSRADKINQLSLLLGLAAVAHLKELHMDALNYYGDVLKAARQCGWRIGYIESIVNASRSVVQYHLGRLDDAEQSDRIARRLYFSRSYFLVGFGTLWPEIIGLWYSKQKRERAIPSCEWERFQQWSQL